MLSISNGMKVILLKDIKGIGRRFEEKEVSDGYANNSLIPKKMAVPVSGSSAKQVLELKKQLEKAKVNKSHTLYETSQKLNSTTVTIKVKANEKGHLFASINKNKLSELLSKEAGINLPGEYIKLTTPIKEIGTFSVPISLKEGSAEFSLKVVPLN